jgi:hypothetical protein
MKPWLRRCALVLSFAAVSCFAVAQRGGTRSPSPAEDETDVRLPNGKVQRDEILKAEHEQNLKDAAVGRPGGTTETGTGKERPLRPLHLHAQEDR